MKSSEIQLIYHLWKSGKPGDRRSRHGCQRMRRRIVRASNFRKERSNCIKQIDDPSKTQVDKLIFRKYQNNFLI